MGGDHTEMHRRRSLCFKYAEVEGNSWVCLRLSVWPECVTLISSGTVRNIFTFMLLWQSACQLRWLHPRLIVSLLVCRLQIWELLFLDGPPKPQTIATGLTVFPTMPFSVGTNTCRLRLEVNMCDSSSHSCHLFIFLHFVFPQCEYHM